MNNPIRDHLNDVLLSMAKTRILLEEIADNLDNPEWRKNKPTDTPYKPKQNIFPPK